jgi:glucosamine kinase
MCAKLSPSLAVASNPSFCYLRAMPLFLGIDGGGTKTKFLVGDEQKIVAEATAEGSNILRTGEEAVRASLHSGLEKLNSDLTQLTRVVAGIAGSSNEQVRATLESILREKLSAEILIVGDMVIAHHAALNGAPGVLVNAGTGSIAYGRNAEGDTARAGGWGFAISDEGSGHWIGRVAVATAMRCFDTRKEEGYVHHLLAALGIAEAQELAKFANSTANPDFAHIFPAVVTIAEKGDEPARKILVHAGAELACLADVILARLFPVVEDVTVAATGGVFRISDIVFESFADDLRDHHHGLSIARAEALPSVH